MLGKSFEKSLSLQEDILNGNNEWLNIQEIVRITFKNMQNTIAAQDRAIQNIERQLSLKVSRAEIQSILNEKLDSEEFQIEIHNLRGVIQAIRTDTSDLICANREDYINDFRKIVAELDTKAEKSETLSQLNEIDYQRNLNSVELKELRKELEGRLGVLKSQFSKEIDYSRELNMIEFDKLQESSKSIFNEILRNKTFAEDSFRDLYNKSKNLERNLEIANEVRAKAEEDNRKIFSSSLNQTNSNLLNEIKALTDNQNRLARELEALRGSKADNSHMVSLLQVKSDEIQTIRQEMESQSSQIKLRAVQSEVEKDLRSLRDALEVSKKDLSLNFEKKISDVQGIVDTKVGHNDHGSALTKQEEINETLCSENTVARWVVEGKRLNGEVIWDCEKINTCPDLFVWEKGSKEISVLKSGCYEVNFGGFAEKPPIIRVLVNGEIVYSLVNRPSYAVQGNVTGVTLTEYMNLEEGSVVQVQCESQHITFAFLSIKKLR